MSSSTWRHLATCTGAILILAVLAACEKSGPGTKPSTTKTPATSGTAAKPAEPGTPGAKVSEASEKPAAAKSPDNPETPAAGWALRSRRSPTTTQ
jgi:hypothetical protein